MALKRFYPELIITLLRQAEIILAKGQTVAEACRQIGVPEQTSYCWRKEYGGVEVGQVKRLKHLEKENSRLKKVVADHTLDIAILKGDPPGRLLSSARRHQAAEHVCRQLTKSERRTCQVL